MAKFGCGCHPDTQMTQMQFRTIAFAWTLNKMFRFTNTLSFIKYHEGLNNQMRSSIRDEIHQNLKSLFS